jgi:glucose-6-phosphate dehydrogenase assembly protein OpcA
MVGGWLRVYMPEIGVDQDLLSYASDRIVTAVQASHPDFEGLLGLPFLRLVEYGGDADWFWVRLAQLAGSTSSPPTAPP